MTIEVWIVIIVMGGRRGPMGSFWGFCKVLFLGLSGGYKGVSLIIIH